MPVVWWAGAITACAIKPDTNLLQILQVLTKKLDQPFSIFYTPYTLRYVFTFTIAYVLGIGIYYSQKRNYRRGVEHGSAKWGDAASICKRYRDKRYTQNLILTQNFRMGLDCYKHKRNLNVLVVGGSGAGKSRAYAVVNIMQCNCSMVVTDPNEFALEIQSVEAAELTRNILIDWIPIFEDKQVDYDIDIPEQPVRVRLDMDSYMRIVNNLIQNVIAHSHADKIKIVLSKKENNMELLLADNGVGIEKDDLKHIFERLYKCDKGRSEKGSGLGLSIVHQLVEKMGGSITVESLPGKGTEFMLLFPLES